MQLRVGLEMNYENRVLAWALDYPGCFAYGKSKEEALLRLPPSFVAYQHWVNLKAGERSWVADINDFDIRLVESFKVYDINDRFEVIDEGGYSVNAWFQSDWLPLTEQEIDHGLMLMEWSRQDLLALLSTIYDDLMEKNFSGERWNIIDIVRHIATAEWWYLDRLGLTNLTKQNLPSETLEALVVVRKQFRNVLPDLVNKELVSGKAGEFWSPRKILRRVLCHEKDHIQHIYQLIS
jgi:hypothetical protein